MGKKYDVLFVGAMKAASGYGHRCRSLVHSLKTAGVDVRWFNPDGMLDNLPGDDPLGKAIVDLEVVGDYATELTIDAGVVIACNIPDQLGQFLVPDCKTIFASTFEATRLNSRWISVFNRADMVWVESDFTVKVFEDSGVDVPLWKAPTSTAWAEMLGPARAIKDFPGKHPALYSVFDWSDRKNPYDLIRGFLAVAHEMPGTHLILRCTNMDPVSFMDFLQAVCETQNYKGPKNITLLDRMLSARQMRYLHEHCDIYVSTHRGEGWGIPMFDAVTFGNPIVSCIGTGEGDYLNPRFMGDVANFWEPVVWANPYDVFEPPMRWMRPDLGGWIDTVIDVLNRLGEYKKLAEKGSEKVKKDYSAEAIGKSLLEALNVLQS